MDDEHSDIDHHFHDAVEGHDDSVDPPDGIADSISSAASFRLSTRSPTDHPLDTRPVARQAETTARLHLCFKIGEFTPHPGRRCRLSSI